MKSLFSPLWPVLLVLAQGSLGHAQVELVRSGFFPAELEFKELLRVRSTQEQTRVEEIGDPALRPYLKVLGFGRFSVRSYDVEAGANLTIEVVSTGDHRAAYSLLTLMAGEKVEPGPPGDFLSACGRGLCFSQERYWVRVSGDSGPVLMRRVAMSVSNRIGNRRTPAPTLVSQLPAKGRVDSSLRYFFGVPVFERFGGVREALRDLPGDSEVAQSDYRVGERGGILALVSFPTSQLAQDYLERVTAAPAGSAAARPLFARRNGPLVGVLAGDLEPASADSLLGTIRYTYSIKWIYDRNNRSGNTVWGIPVGILGTVVRSVVFTAILCGFSILGGVGIAAFRVLLRGVAPGNVLDDPERTGLIRLKLDEK